MTTTQTIQPELARLRRIIEETGRTQTEIAIDAGMSPGNLSRILSGGRRTSLVVVKQVLAACGATWADLVGE